MDIQKNNVIDPKSHSWLAELELWNKFLFLSWLKMAKNHGLFSKFYYTSFYNTLNLNDTLLLKNCYKICIELGFENNIYIYSSK